MQGSIINENKDLLEGDFALKEEISTILPNILDIQAIEVSNSTSYIYITEEDKENESNNYYIKPNKIFVAYHTGSSPIDIEFKSSSDQKYRVIGFYPIPYDSSDFSSNDSTYYFSTPTSATNLYREVTLSRDNCVIGISFPEP